MVTVHLVTMVTVHLVTMDQALPETWSVFERGGGEDNEPDRDATATCGSVCGRSWIQLGLSGSCLEMPRLASETSAKILP